MYLTFPVFFFFSGFYRKFHGHSSLKEYYEKESCVHYIHNVRSAFAYTSHLLISCFSFWSVCVFVSCMDFYLQVKVPLLLVNSADDPLVHDSLLTIPRTLAGNEQHVSWQQQRYQTTVLKKSIQAILTTFTLATIMYAFEILMIFYWSFM